MYEYFCEHCQVKFEQITSFSDPERGKCPKCKKKSEKRLISKFAVGGQGDLRESTLHGCHDCHVSVGDESPSHSHDSNSHDHDSHDHGHNHDSDE